MQEVFEYDVNDLENFPPESRVASSSFEEKVERTQFLQGLLITFLDEEKYEGTLDINRLLDHCKRFLAVAELTGPNDSKEYMAKKYGESGYIKRISLDLEFLKLSLK